MRGPSLSACSLDFRRAPRASPSSVPGGERVADYQVITTPEACEEAALILAAGSGPAAVDVERASGFRYSQRAYLIQVFRRDSGVFLFDPPAIGDMSPLQEAIGDELWVLHAASQDLPSLRELGLIPPRIFDTDSNYTFDATETEPPNTNSFFGQGGYSVWAADTTQQKVRGCIIISSGLGSDISKCLDMTFQ